MALRKYRRRRRTTRRRRTRRKLRIHKAIPTKQYVKFRYGAIETIGSAAGAGLNALYSFRANSINDPDFTGTGHRPYGYDLYNGMYNFYTVISSKIRVQFASRNTGTTASGLCGIAIENDSVFSTDAQLALEAQHSRHKLFDTLGSGRMPMVTRSYNAKRYWGVKDIADNPEMGALMAADPVNPVFYHVWIAPTNTADTVLQTDMIVTIEYTCLLTSPEEQATAS